MNSNWTEPLLKVTPQGADVPPYSPYFITPENLNQAITSGKPLAEALGLPLKTTVDSYDILQITPNQPVTTFTSPLAPTTEFEGLYTTDPVTSQELVLNRNLWSAPVKVGTVPNVGGTPFGTP